MIYHTQYTSDTKLYIYIYIICFNNMLVIPIDMIIYDLINQDGWIYLPKKLRYNAFIETCNLMDGLLVSCLKNPSSVAGHHLAPRCLGLPGTAPVSEALRKGPVRQGAVGTVDV